ncbi:ecotin family protein [Synechococcus sp. MIT S9451]|uniref:ecotin family protein n=1 Tax=Synechococcus sp. MIT S9451 TaxID=3082543 RepID=UPI0039B4170D
MAKGLFNLFSAVGGLRAARSAAVLTMLCLGAAGPVHAIPRLDLSGYPAPAAGLQRWVIQPSGLLPQSSDPLISSHPIDWRVQLIVGKEVELGCNNTWLSGPALTMKRLPQAVGKALFVLNGPLVVMSTRKLCASDEPHKRSFLTLGKQPYLVPYNASWPIVVDLPEGVKLRWRVWKAETKQLLGVMLE